ncbi:hypothetical protein BMS3Bbin07_00897 [bacterium BMS3Bbin07]|nr:hypothetical protein BMS3Bbin07_00897 [bacterium BMS3Bbin07]
MHLRLILQDRGVFKEDQFCIYCMGGAEPVRLYDHSPPAQFFLLNPLQIDGNPLTRICLFNWLTVTLKSPDLALYTGRQYLHLGI